MGKITNAFTKLITGSDAVAPISRGKKFTSRDLIRMESKIGAQLFGDLPKGHRRDFFCLDEHTWIWYEEWPDAKGKMVNVTTRYEIHPNGILKVQDGQPYQVVEGEELRNFAMATRMYREHVIRTVYHRDPVTGQPLALQQ
jgi:hypothetical protein